MSTPSMRTCPRCGAYQPVRSAICMRVGCGYSWPPAMPTQAPPGAAYRPAAAPAAPVVQMAPAAPVTVSASFRLPQVPRWTAATLAAAGALLVVAAGLYLASPSEEAYA